MTKFIDIDAFEAELYRQDEKCGSNVWETHEIVKAMELFPTVDAVEVVRCKDCRHGMKSHLQPRHAKNYLCRHSWEGEYHEPDHFCSYGERRK